MFRNASLSRRLLLGASVFIALALALAAFVIFFALHRFVQGQIDQRLDTQIVFLSSMLQTEADGTLHLSGNADGPPFDRPRRGWYWQISGPRNTLRSRSLDDTDLVISEFPRRPHGPLPPPPRPDEVWQGARPEPADGLGPNGRPLHARVFAMTASGTPITIVTSAPRAAVTGPLREAMTTIVISLGVLGIGLILAIVLQVRLGLRPLERLRNAVADVRAGRNERVPPEQPNEVRPLVTELNALLEQNAANLERARGHVANLAHGLNTPLATLAIALSDRGKTSTEDLQSLVSLMERRVRHHLSRARAAALAGPARARTRIAPRTADLGDVLKKLHADKGLTLTIAIPDGMTVACEPQDFDEMAGNLMENAFKWARTQVRVEAMAGEREVVLTIRDDGPGLKPEQIPQVLRPGTRLDESAPGFGFGLAITRELAELYGGELRLDTTAGSGLAASLRLPG